MFKNLFRPRRSNKENEDQQQHQQQQQQQNPNEFDHAVSTYRLIRNIQREKRPSYSNHHHCRGNGGGSGDDGFLAPTAPYHVATQRKHHRGTQSCYDGFNDEFDRFSNINRSFAGATHSKYKPSRRDYMSSTRRHMQLEYGSCDPSPNTHGMYNRDLDDSDTETWNSERIIKELRAELRVTNDRKNYYKDLYKRERQDRIRDRELRDLVEKKLMDDLRSKEIECSNNLLRIKALEQQLQHHSNFPPPMRDSSFRIPHFCTPSTSNTVSTMGGAGEALSSTSELFGLRSTYLTNPTGPGATVTAASVAVVPSSLSEMPDETKDYRHHDEFSLELGRNSSGGGDERLNIRNDEATQVSMNFALTNYSNSNLNGTVLEEDPQSDNGYGTTSECASELVRSIRRVHSDSALPLKVVQI